MKLLLCLDCNSIFNLSYKEKSCECGNVSGKYFDEINAVYTGNSAIPLGIANESLRGAVINQPVNGLGERFDAFVIQRDCETFKQVHENRG